MQNINVIFGAPGCGKTTRLLSILEEELKSVAPNRIAFASFTKKGTYEGRDRVMAKFSLKEEDLPYFRTLHSLAFRSGDYSKVDIINKRHYREFSVAMGMHFSGYYTEEMYSNDDRYLFIHFLKRNNPEAAKIYLPTVDARKLRDVETNYERFRLHCKVIDFTDIIEAFILRNEALPVDVAIIDEAQDLTSLQWKMCEVAFRDAKRVYIAGDDDQAIYEWSGADVGHFLALRGKREVLAQSYRLRRQVLSLAKGISRQISKRVEKDFAPMQEEGAVRFYNSPEEILIDPAQSWYFLARNNWFLQQYRDLLRKKAFVFADKHGLSFDPKQIRAINLWEKLRRTKHLTEVEDVQLKQHLKPKTDLAYPWFNNLDFDNDTIAYYKDLVKWKTDLARVNMEVSTIHGVKGGEADNVVLMLDFTRSVRANFETNPDSELRCLYVACTRAKKTLHIVYSRTSNGYDSFMKLEELNGSKL